MRTIYEFLAAEDGVTAVEYAVMLALIIAACMTAVGSLGDSTSDSFGNARDKIGDAVAAGQ